MSYLSGSEWRDHWQKMASGKILPSESRLYEIGTAKIQSGGGENTTSIKRYMKRGQKRNGPQKGKKNPIKGRANGGRAQSAKSVQGGKTKKPGKRAKKTSKPKKTVKKTSKPKKTTKKSATPKSLF